MVSSRATIVPSPEMDWYTKCIPSEVPEVPEPAPVTVNISFANVALPTKPTEPTSWSSHGVGNGCEVNVSFTALLSFMVGPTDTTSGPDVSPDGIVTTIDPSTQPLTVTSASFRSTPVLPS